MNFYPNKLSQIETKTLIWKGRPIYGYFIRNDGKLFHNERQCAIQKRNGRNYSMVEIDGHSWLYRIDYMVAYTFKVFYDDAIRLIHVNGDISDDRVGNLMWFRKIDIMEKYRDLAIIEPDGSIKEKWKPCKLEYNSTIEYEVSNFGFIRAKKDKHMITIHESHGYRVFYYLDAHNKATRVKAVHRAVAEAFIPKPNKEWSLVNHLDGDKFNDIVSNLEWCDNGMNVEHAYTQKLNLKTEYTQEQVELACKLMSTSDIPQIQISYMTGIDRKTLSDIYRGRRWKSISSNYSFRTRKWTPELKESICKMIIDGKKAKEIFSILNMEYDQSATSFYERMRRELKADGKI